MTYLPKTVAVLWIIWGLVHVLAGVIILSSDATGSVQAIADAVSPEDLVNTYHPAVGAVFNQHGWNLLWIGVVTTLCAPFIWREALTGFWLAALVGGLADVGYFVFVDLGGFANFIPGTLMTIISGSAIVLSLVWYFTRPAPQTAS